MESINACNFKARDDVPDSYDDQGHAVFSDRPICLLKNPKGFCDDSKCILMILFKPSYVITP